MVNIRPVTRLGCIRMWVMLSWVVVGFGMYPFLYAYLSFFRLPYFQFLYILLLVGGVFFMTQQMFTCDRNPISNNNNNNEAQAEPVAVAVAIPMNSPSPPSSSAVDTTAVEMGVKVFTYSTRHQQQPQFTEQEECVICMCEYEEEDAVAVLPTCQHAFHVDCLKRWLQCQPRCPICNSCLLQKLGSSQRKNDHVPRLSLHPSLEENV